MNLCIVCVWEFENYIIALNNCTYEQIIWRQYSEIEKIVTETRLSDITPEPCYWNVSYNRISVELPLPCYTCRLFLWKIAFPNHTHVISLLLIFADTCRTTELHIFHLGYFQISISYVICKFQFLFFFLLLIIKTKTPHNRYERIIISCKNI